MPWMLRHPSLLLWLATLVVWLPWLGNQPLRDWDEGIVASVAHATMSQTGLDRLIAIQWTNAYLNKPPGATQPWPKSSKTDPYHPKRKQRCRHHRVDPPPGQSRGSDPVSIQHPLSGSKRTTVSCGMGCG